jgi:NAD(P)-dependent dehydrogenase (short-subunit alcohol dehydrogenase family)
MLQGRVAAVTGAASGIGRCIADALAAAGAQVVAVDRSPDEPEDGRRDAQVFLTCDVRSADAVGRTFADIARRFGAVDILVNSAGVREIAHPLDLEPAEWEDVIGVDLSGTFYCCQAAGRMMRDAGRGGAIVNIASVAGLIGQSRRAAYTAAKHGVIGLTKALAKDYAAFGVRVNALCPGIVRTPMTAAYADDEVFLQSALPSVPQGRLAEPQDVADAALFLVGDHSRHITGIALPIDGGWLAEKGYVATGSGPSAFYGSRPN